MPFAQLGILVGVLALLLVGLFALFIFMRKPEKLDLPEEMQRAVSDAQVETYERPASIVAEQIEAVARKKLEQYPDLSDIVLDFGTMPDGTIDIWVNRKQYDNVEDIFDERIREAIQEAVRAFNEMP